MADVTKTVEIIFGARSDVAKVTNQINRDFDNIGKSVTDVTRPLDSITNKVLGLQAAFTLLALGGMALAVKESSSFNQGFALISTSIDAAGGDLAKYRQDVLNYAGTSVKTMEDINASLYTAAQAGVKYGDSLEFIRKAEELAVANKANLNTTVDLLTGTMNAYGFTLKDVAHINDVFFTSTLIGKQTIDELGASMGNVVAIAANSGVSFEELSAAIATMTAKGMGTEEAITAVKNVITTIIAPSKEAADAAKALGLNFSLTELSSKGFSGMLSEIYTKTHGSKEKMVELFSEMRAMNGVLQLTGDGMKFFNNALDQTVNSAGNSQKAYEKMVGTFTSQSQMIVNSAKIMLIEVGTRLEPIAANIAGSFTGVLGGMREGLAKGAFDPLFAYLETFGKRIADTLRIIGKNLPEALEGLDFTGLIHSFEGLGGSVGDAFKAIFGEIDLTTPEGLHKALQKIVDALAALTNISKGVIDGMEPLFKIIGAGIDKFSKLDESSAGLIGTLLGVAKSINILADYSQVLTAVLTILSGKAILDTGLAVTRLGATMASAIPGLVAYVNSVGALGASATFGVAGAAVALSLMTGSILNQIPAVKSGSQALLGLIDTNKDFFGAQGRSKEELDATNKKFDEAVAKHKALSGESKAVTTATDAYNKSLQALDFAKAKTAFDELNAVLKKTRDGLSETAAMKDLDVTIKVQADGTTIEKSYQAIIKRFPDGQTLITNVGVEADEAGIARTKKKIDEAIPKDKQIEIQAKLDEAKIKEQSEIIQKSLEWKAKLDIANVEANAKIIEATFKSIDNTIISTGETLSSLMGAWAELQGAGRGGTSFIEQQIADENRRRNEALEMQKKLTDAEIENFKARTEAIKGGQAMIQIDGKGLQPQLEAFMFEILKQIQVRANAEGAKYLVGL